MTRGSITRCCRSSGARSRRRGLEQVALDALLDRLAADGLVRAGGKQRTDSTHVVAAVAALNRLELAGEACGRRWRRWRPRIRTGWRSGSACRDFARRYGTPMTSWRPPAVQGAADKLAIAYARDGYALLEAVYAPSSPAWLREIPAVDDAAPGPAAELHPDHRPRTGGRWSGGGRRSRKATVSRTAKPGSPPRMTPMPCDA